MFFDRGSPALAEINDYFEGIAQKGVVVTTIDQALDPALSKTLKVSKNGTVALRCGERSETWFVGNERAILFRSTRNIRNCLRRIETSVDPNVTAVAKATTAN